jgi:hypothetical protein
LSLLASRSARFMGYGGLADGRRFSVRPLARWLSLSPPWNWRRGAPPAALCWFTTVDCTANAGPGALIGFRGRCATVGRYAGGSVSIYGAEAVGMGGSGWDCSGAVALELSVCEDVGDGNGFRLGPVGPGNGGPCISPSFSEAELSSWSESSLMIASSSEPWTCRKYSELWMSSAVTTFCRGLIGVRNISSQQSASERTGMAHSYHTSASRYSRNVKGQQLQTS